MEFLGSCEYALQLERECRDFYTENAARFAHPAAAAVFRDMAQEADLHIKFIKGVIKASRAGDIKRLPRSAADDEGKLAWRSIADVMSKDTAVLLRPDIGILRLGLLLQRDVSAYYQESAEQMSGLEHDAMEKLAEWSDALSSALKALFDSVFALYAA